jgi:hypothetical protein
MSEREKGAERITNDEKTEQQHPTASTNTDDDLAILSQRFLPPPPAPLFFDPASVGKLFLSAVHVSA